MKIEPQISYKNLAESQALTHVILSRVEKLEHLFPRITGCQVLIESPHRKHHRGNQYHVRINLAVPGKDIVVARNPAKNETHKDAYVAIRDAFNAMDRRLRDYSHEIRGAVKTHQLTRDASPKEMQLNEDLNYSQNFRTSYFERTQRH